MDDKFFHISSLNHVYALKTLQKNTKTFCKLLLKLVLPAWSLCFLLLGVCSSTLCNDDEICAAWNWHMLHYLLYWGLNMVADTLLTRFSKAFDVKETFVFSFESCWSLSGQQRGLQNNWYPKKLWRKCMDYSHQYSSLQSVYILWNYFGPQWDDEINTL